MEGENGQDYALGFAGEASAILDINKALKQLLNRKEVGSKAVGIKVDVSNSKGLNSFEVLIGSRQINI